jgi:RND family efflux transporter MFP subunit
MNSSKIMKYTILSIISLITLLQACTPSAEKNGNGIPRLEVIPVNTMPVQREEVSMVIRSSGTFTTDDETYLSFKTGGVIDKIYVKEGDAVKQGQVLARLNLTEIDAQVAQAKLAYDKAVRDFKRAENLYNDSVATKEQFQNARTGLEVATRQLEAANFNRTYSEIKAVANGFVLRKMASEGQVIGPGIPILLTNGAGANQWKMKIMVSDREWAMLQPGDRASITTDVLPGQTLTAIVTRKSEGSETLGGSFSVELSLEGNVTGLAAGLYGKVDIQASRKEMYWKIPYEALLDGDAQSAFVFITDDGKSVRKIPVKVARLEKDVVYIRSGLENVTNLIVTGSAYLRDGSTIEVIQ